MGNFLIPFFCVFALLIFYPAFIVYVAIVLDVGVYSWAMVFFMLSPIAMFAYSVAKKRFENCLSLQLESCTHEWSVSETVVEYQKMLETQRHKS